MHPDVVKQKFKQQFKDLVYLDRNAAEPTKINPTYDEVNPKTLNKWQDLFIKTGVDIIFPKTPADVEKKVTSFKTKVGIGVTGILMAAMLSVTVLIMLGDL